MYLLGFNWVGIFVESFSKMHHAKFNLSLLFVSVLFLWVYLLMSLLHITWGLESMGNYWLWDFFEGNFLVSASQYLKFLRFLFFACLYLRLIKGVLMDIVVVLRNILKQIINYFIVELTLFFSHWEYLLIWIYLVMSS